jgi:hypothetical protein
VRTANQGLSRLGLGNFLDEAWDGDDLDKILTGESPICALSMAALILEFGVTSLVASVCWAGLL